MIINNEFEIGQSVYLKTDTQQLERIVCGICVSQKELLYELCLGSTVSKHYNFEITEDINVLKKIENA